MHRPIRNPTIVHLLANNLPGCNLVDDSIAIGRLDRRVVPPGVLKAVAELVCSKVLFIRQWEMAILVRTRFSWTVDLVWLANQYAQNLWRRNGAQKRILWLGWIGRKWNLGRFPLRISCRDLNVTNIRHAPGLQSGSSVDLWLVFPAQLNLESLRGWHLQLKVP